MVKFRRSAREEVSVNLTPLIDVVFLLLIFFMVSTSFNKDFQQEIQLPESTSKTTISENNPVIISADADGKISVNDQTLNKQDFQSLELVLKQLNLPSDTNIIYRSDAQSPLSAFIMVSNVTSNLGLTKLMVATKEVD